MNYQRLSTKSNVLAGCFSLLGLGYTDKMMDEKKRHNYIC